MRLFLLLLLCAIGCSAHAASPRPKVIFFANPMTSDNDVIRRPQPDALSIAERHFRALSEGIFEVTITQNGADLTREAFSHVNAVVFFTAINPPGPDIDALLAWVRAGGAFVGIHSTANTYQRIPAFGELLGARYDRRPWRTTQAPQTTVRITVLDRTHPATRHLGASFQIADDIYQFKDLDHANVKVLLSLDPSSLDLKNPKVNRDDTRYPIAWTKELGEGRVFYTALGDWETTWIDSRFRTHLIEGIKWAMRSVPK
jgi:type 1 glutamine amidotransferase